jgi:hypothetical protein
MISALAMSLALGFPLGLAPVAFGFLLATALGFLDNVGIALSTRVGGISRSSYHALPEVNAKVGPPPRVFPIILLQALAFGSA